MSTQKLYIVKNYGESDGLVKTRDNVVIGEAWNKEGPEDKYITISLNKHWIITDEENKLLTKLKRNGELSNLAKG